jgi:transcriptional regulator with XRE-family HTH domain
LPLKWLGMIEKEEYLKAFGKHLRKIREEKGISLREVELRGDLDRQWLSKIELGKINPTLYSLRKLCELLEIDVSDLFVKFKK